MTPDGKPFVVLGVCGGIAAYKAVEVCRQLVAAGMHVVPVLTTDAQRFIGAATFSALASEPAHTSVWDGPHPSPHTMLGRQADLIVVAPATARFLAAHAIGLSDDLLGLTLMASRARVVVAPAMHTEMWEQPSVQQNVATLAERGVVIVPPAIGALAGGDHGVGRLAEPDDIVAAALAQMHAPDFAGRRVVVTAGGTKEPLDPVRFLGNRSSGRQGHAIAEAAAARGADVVLVTASSLAAPHGVRTIVVSTAQDMLNAVTAEADAADLIVMAAAVADFRPSQVAGTKIKKTDGVPVVSLEATVDILSALVKARRSGQVIVGFAAETTDLVGNARKKLHDKGVDMIVANDVSLADRGFDALSNEVVIVQTSGERTVALRSKLGVAHEVLDDAVALLGASTAS